MDKSRLAGAEGALHRGRSRRRTRDEWCALLEGTDVCFAPVLSHERGARATRTTWHAAPSSRSPASSQPAPAPRFARTPGSIDSPAAARRPAHRRGPGGRRHRRGPRRQARAPRAPWPDDGHARLLPRPSRRRVDRHRRPMARAAAEGHRVVLVIATRGELGEIVPGVLDDGRAARARVAAPELCGVGEVAGRVTGRVARLRRLRDDGQAPNDAPWCFWQADVDEAAERLAAILDDGAAPTCSRSTTTTAATATPTTSRCTGSALRAAELAGVERRLPVDDEPRSPGPLVGGPT